MSSIATTFAAGASGPWLIDRVVPLTGSGMAAAARLATFEHGQAPAPLAQWSLLGVPGHERYLTRAEADVLRPISPSLGRAKATHAALIPIRKSSAWWALAQDERREVLAESSNHIAIGAEYVPAIARKLYHSRDLGEEFDFLTWFEFAPAAALDFERLLERLRATLEWSFVEREVEVRLRRA